MRTRFTPVEFQAHGSRRRLVPRWLVLLLTGITIGAGAVVLVQEHVLPPRLSAEESAGLRSSAEQAEPERLRLQAELDDTRQRLDAALAERKSLADQASASRDTIEVLRKDAARLITLMPSDPRPGAIAVRAARFRLEGGSLAYDVLLTRDRVGGDPLAGVMQLVVAADSGRGPAKTVTLEPVVISVGSFESLSGKLRLPEGFRPNQATINLLDRVDGQRLGSRIMVVR